MSVLHLGPAVCFRVSIRLHCPFLTHFPSLSKAVGTADRPHVKGSGWSKRKKYEENKNGLGGTVYHLCSYNIQYNAHTQFCNINVVVISQLENLLLFIISAVQMPIQPQCH